MTFFLHADYGGSQQGAGGFDLRQLPCSVIGDILTVLDVESWEQLPGKPMRVKIADRGIVEAVGHFIKDEWVNFPDWFTPKE